MAKQSYKAKTELFRFATLRKPTLIDSDSKRIGFVINQDTPSSYFLKALRNESTLDAARDALPSLAKKFKRLNRVEEITSIDGKLYSFSSWLMLNRSQLNSTEFDKAITGVRPLSNNNRSVLWDNLYAEAILKTSDPINHACIQLLVADHVLQNHASTELMEAFGRMRAQRGMDLPKIRRQYLRRLAHASVVLHHVFGTTVDRSKEEDKDTRPPKDILHDHENFIRSEKIKELELISKDIVNLQKVYEQDKDKIYQVALADHETKVKEEVARFNKANKLDGLNQEALNKINPDTLPDFVQPELVVKYPQPISEGYLKGKVSDKTLDFVQKNQSSNTEIKTLQKSVETLINRERQGLYLKYGKGKKRVKLAGKAYAIQSNRERAFTLGFKTDGQNEESKSSIFLTLRTTAQNAFVKSIRYGIQIGTDPERKGTDFKEKARNKSTLFLALFPDKAFNVQDGLTYTFQAEVVLSDNQEWKLELVGQTGLNTNWAIAKTNEKTIRQTSLPMEFEGVDIYGVNRIGIADYRLVEQEICCYVPAEVSHIENILAREYKERHTRSLTSTETTTESETQFEVENKTDTSTTERNEINTEIAAILNEERSNSVGVNTGVSGTYMDVTISVDAGVDFASSNSSSDSNTMAKNYAMDVTKAASERVLQKTTEKRTSKMLQEYEENNRHGFDNRAGDQHVTGVYRWIDKVMTNRLVNYGKRLIYEFMIPEPSKFYRQAIEIQLEEELAASAVSVLLEPVHPSMLEPPINSAMDIARENYLAIAAIYGATPAAPKDQYSSLSESYSSSSLDKKEFSQTLMPPISIPMDYVAKRTTGTLTYDWEAKRPANDGGAFINITFAGKSYKSGTREGKRSRTTIPASYTLPGGVEGEIPGLIFNHGDKTGSLSGSVSGNKLFSYNISVDTELELKSEVYEQWQMDTYSDIMSAYNQLKAAYDASLAKEESAKKNDPKQMKINANMYRQIEQTELKRIAIEMLTKPYQIPQGKSFTTPVACGIPSVVQDAELDNYSSHVKFFEQAFDWGIMSYLFYPYYWAKKCDWVELFQAQKGDDEIFSSFLQSGMARLTVPVRLGFEKAVIFYMATGKIWMGGDLVLDSDDDLYLSIAEELEVIEGHVEEEWQTILPTSLNIVQKDSASLDASGLPCCDDVGSEVTGLIASTNVLSRAE